MAGPAAGVAVRQSVGERGRTGVITGTVDLPELSTAAVAKAVRELRTATGAAAEPCAAVRMALLTESLADTGRRIWAPLLAEWPELPTERVALAPVGEILHLPLHTALIDGVPACTVLDLATRLPTHAPAPLDTLPPDGHHAAPPEQLSRHGILDADEPWRSSLMQGRRIGDALLVLSGGRLDSAPALPVLGAVWPLAEPARGAELLGHLHRAIVGLPEASGLRELVAESHAHGLSTAVWGPFVHFGA